MIRVMFIVLVVFLSGLSSCNKAQNGLNLESGIKYNEELPLDSFALSIMQHYKLPGLAIGIVNSDGEIETSVIGDNTTENGQPLTNKSKFQLASCTKSFTALLVAELVCNEKIKWNTTVEEIFSDMDIHPDNKTITIIELLSHTSGLCQFWTNEEVFNIEALIPNLTGDIKQQRNCFSKWNLERSPQFTRGEYQYSNAAYVIIASIVETLTGKSYERLISEKLFNQLNLRSAEFGYPFLIDKSQPHRHMRRDEKGTGIALKTDERLPHPIFNSCGFISLTIEDFSKYLKYCIEIQKRDYSESFCDVGKELFKNHVVAPNGFGIGLGWQIIEINGISTFGHTGSDQSTRAAMSINKTSNKGVVFTTNIGDSLSEMAMVNVISELIK